MINTFLRPKSPIMKIAMMGPRAVGKTTILTSVFNETSTSIATTKLNLIAYGDTKKELQDRLYYLKSVFKTQQDITQQPPAGLAASADEHSFGFGFGITGQNPKIDIEIKDFPGEYLLNKQERVKEFINDATAIYIAIDTPHLMERNGSFNEIKNKVSIITEFFQQTIKNFTSEKLVLFVPLKCEKYFNEKRMVEVLNRVKEEYEVLISLFKQSEKICCAVTPILTLGDVVFDDFQYDEGGNVNIDIDGTPLMAQYKYVEDKPKYSPRFCSQPLYSTLSFLVAQCRRHKNATIFEKILSAIRNVFMSDEKFYTEVLKMEGFRISDNQMLGYEVLCGGEFFHYNH